MTKSWHEIADLLGKRLANHAFCNTHPQSLPDPECPFCEDRTVYQEYLKKRGRSA